MSSNSQFSQVKAELKEQKQRLAKAEKALDEMQRANVNGALESLARQQQNAKQVAANPSSSVEELQNALPHLTSPAYQEQVRHNIRMQQMEQQNAQVLENLPNLWNSPLVKNIQQGYRDGSYQQWRNSIKR